MSESIEQIIEQSFNEVFKEQNPSINVPKLKEETILLDTGLDSLGFAILVVNLEEKLGFDPFVISEEAFYPKTFKEFISFYKDNKPQ